MTSNVSAHPNTYNYTWHPHRLPRMSALQHIYLNWRSRRYFFDFMCDLVSTPPKSLRMCLPIMLLFKPAIEVLFVLCYVCFVRSQLQTPPAFEWVYPPRHIWWHLASSSRPPQVSALRCIYLNRILRCTRLIGPTYAPTKLPDKEVMPKDKKPVVHLRELGSDWNVLTSLG